MGRERTATYQHLLDAPDDVTAELLDGELLLSPRPPPRHQHAVKRLATLLDDAFELGRTGPGGWLFMYEPELHLLPKTRVLVPDLAGWLAPRAAGLDFDAVVEVMPDWVCEVLSPPHARLDRLKKMPLYAGHGVAWLWLVDPLARTLEVYRREPEGYLLLGALGDGEFIRAPPFDALELPLGSLWLPAPAAEEPLAR